METSVPNLGRVVVARRTRPTIVGVKAQRNRLTAIGKGSRKATASLIRRLSSNWRSGGEQFIRAAVSRVAVDTGMTAATFLEFSRAIKRNNVEAFIEQKINSQRKRLFRDGIPTFQTGKRRPGFQDEETGESLGKKAFVFVTPEAPSVGKKTQVVFKFSFQTVAFQHAYHDDKGSMWKSMDAGFAAFEATIRKAFETDARFMLDAFFGGKSIIAQNIGQV